MLNKIFIYDNFYSYLLTIDFNMKSLTYTYTYLRQARHNIKTIDHINIEFVQRHRTGQVLRHDRGSGVGDCRQHVGNLNIDYILLFVRTRSGCSGGGSGGHRSNKRCNKSRMQSDIRIIHKVTDLLMQRVLQLSDDE